LNIKFSVSVNLSALALITTALSATAQEAAAPARNFEDAHEGERIVITGSPIARDLFEQTQSISILTGENLRLRLEPTVGETLNREPGVSSTYFGPGASRPVIRGLGEDRVRVLQNGVNILDVSNVSPDHAVTAEPLTIRTIEVVRGPATLLYGPNTVGGVVNVMDNRVPTESLAKPIEGKLDSRFGTVDDLRSGAGLLEFQLGRVVVHLDASIRETDDLKIPGFARSERRRLLDPLPPGEREPRGTLPNSFTESQGGAAGASYVWDGGYIGAAFSGTDSRYGTVAEPDVTIELEQRRWDFRGSFAKPITGLKAINYKIAYSDYNHTEFEGDEVGTVFAIDGYDGRLEALHEKLGPFEGAVGYQTQRNDFSALGEEAFLPPVETEIHSAFVFEEIVFNAVRLQFGTRFDHQRNQRQETDEFGPSLSREFDAFSGSAGFVYVPVEPYAIAFSVAYSQRPPTYVELFANGPHIATGAFEVGDLNLGLEDSLGFDLSFRKKAGRVTGAISLFYNRFSNFITAVPTGMLSEADDDEEGLPIFAYRATDADFIGGEVETTLHIIERTPSSAPTTEPADAKAVAIERIQSRHQLHVELKADYVRAQDWKTDRSLPRITPFRTGATVVYSWDDRFHARVEGQYSHEQNRTAEFELPTDSYFLLNASMSYRVPVGPVEFDVYLKGTNLTNEEARVHTSFLKEIAPLAGRGALLGMRASF
jgi:iron complex outermembrane receptor protein